MTGRARSSRSSSSPAHLVVGIVGRAVGLRGEVEVAVWSDDPARFAPGSQLRTSQGRGLTVRSGRSRGDHVVVAFEEVGDRTGAEALRGVELRIPVEHARALGEGEYWDHDLIGCRVVGADGRDVGEVTDVLHQPSSEILSVRTEAGERLIPLVAAVVRAVDLDRGEITIDLLPGLLE